MERWTGQTCAERRFVRSERPCSGCRPASQRPTRARRRNRHACRLASDRGPDALWPAVRENHPGREDHFASASDGGNRDARLDIRLTGQLFISEVARRTPLRKSFQLIASNPAACACRSCPESQTTRGLKSGRRPAGWARPHKSSAVKGLLFTFIIRRVPT